MHALDDARARRLGDVEVEQVPSVGANDDETREGTCSHGGDLEADADGALQAARLQVPHLDLAEATRGDGVVDARRDDVNVDEVAAVHVKQLVHLRRTQRVEGHDDSLQRSIEWLRRTCEYLIASWKVQVISVISSKYMYIWISNEKLEVI